MTSATVEPWGLAGDRRWMVVDEAGEAITAREAHRMLLVHPRQVEGGLTVTAPGLTPLETAEPHGVEPVPVTVHGKPVRATPAGAGADAWFGRAIGRSARLVFLDDPTHRPTNPAFSRSGDRVSLADAYPLLLATEESHTAVNEIVAAGPLADEGPLPMIRYRPNLVVRGAPAWAEDDWRRLRIGAAEFRVVKGCDRCVVTTLDPETAAAGKEPIRALSTHRAWDGKTWFGVQLIPDTPGARLTLGDEVEVLDAVEPGNGPPR